MKFDQGNQPYPVHCCVCVQAGDKTPATHTVEGYYLCSVHQDFSPAVLKSQKWGQGKVT